jgi:putative oxygen-independent coproporphyrinogen III oxidase
MNHTKESLGIYIHWPFCVSKCPYCDFNSHVREQINPTQWQEAYLKELDFLGSQTSRRLLTSVFFGGGTPSLMDPRIVESILDHLSHYWCLDPTLEVTLEANPNSAEQEKFYAFKAAGVNRLSVGIQSLYDTSLKFLGRAHGRKEALQALQLAQKIFPRFSFDLIYARPSQSLQEWRQELEEALTYASSHLSLYQLTLEQGTAFYTQAKAGRIHLPDERHATDLYELTQEIMERAGMPYYEISNHALPGYESRHNLIYWRSQDYGAIGPGAHGRLSQKGKRWATKNFRTPERWLKAVQEKGNGTEETLEITLSEQIDELLIMGLRLREGISLSRLENLIEKPFFHILHKEKLASFIEQRFLNLEHDKLKVTPKGHLYLNFLLRELII